MSCVNRSCMRCSCACSRCRQAVGAIDSGERTAAAPTVGDLPGQDGREAGPAVTDYRLKGVVKRVEYELEHVTIQHEAIPGFMDAMTNAICL